MIKVELTNLLVLIIVFLLYSELSSPMPVTRATIVKDSKNVTIANKAEVYHVHSKEERESSNFEGMCHFQYIL